MDKNELKDDIKNAIEDIWDDYKSYQQKYKFETNGAYQRPSAPKDYAGMKLNFPHAVGLVIGCAMARLFRLNIIGYILSMLFFAFLVGVHKSTYNDKISLKYAVIKNIILLLRLLALIALSVILILIAYALHWGQWT